MAKFVESQPTSTNADTCYTRHLEWSGFLTPTDLRWPGPTRRRPRPGAATPFWRSDGGRLTVQWRRLLRSCLPPPPPSWPPAEHTAAGPPQQAAGQCDRRYRPEWRRLWHHGEEGSPSVMSWGGGSPFVMWGAGSPFVPSWGGRMSLAAFPDSDSVMLSDCSAVSSGSGQVSAVATRPVHDVGLLDEDIHCTSEACLSSAIQRQGCQHRQLRGSLRRTGKW